jgi:hypothetical protein
LRQFPHDVLIASLLFRRQGDAGQLEIAQGVVDDLALRRIEPGIFRPVGDVSIGAV